MKTNGCKTKCEDCPVEVLPAQQDPVLQDIEQYRLQMAGISTAAIGYWKESDGIHPDYDTPALRDVAKLYAKYDELYRAQPAQQEPVKHELQCICGCSWEIDADGNEELVSSPPAQRTWVGLTDDEIYMNCPNWLSQEQCKVWVQQIEAKLKEKNT